MANYFEKLYTVDVNKYVEKKNNFSYLSWSYSWAELKKRYPFANYHVFETPEGLNYFTDGKTCWVKVAVSVPEEVGTIEHVEMLPVMDYRHNAIPLEKVTSCEVNTAIQRALTKAIARHGLGLYIYAGEDLPEEATLKTATPPTPPKTAKKTAPAPQPQPVDPQDTETQNCMQCGKPIEAGGGMTSAQVAEARFKKFGMPLCQRCANVVRERQKANETNIAEAFNGTAEA